MTEETPSLFEVALYLICSSRNALDETLPYASMRMLDAAGRLMAAAAGADPDPFFAGMPARVEETKVQVMHDLESYTRALEALQEEFVAEARGRNTAEKSP